ncbi:hypothetical protein CEW89_13085 [Celeribacter ethanolicus]|uniref:Uncharacterized protein n=1 Tax=Celeribacter ethanolicus TaxID=1758178 RepID=A0A291GCZ3_9RHOB|nr:hypothetical protein [Celeribacter ethanolicus]ATG48413.1 hypothetical protein CEW89_13085 [Celeribacter ethanolicus]
MSQTLRDFIANREGEVKAQIKALNDELRELRAAKSAIDGGPSPVADRVPSGRMTHRDMIVAILDERPEGGTSDKVIEWVREKFDVDIPQASMSSQLSRAKSDDVLTLDPSTKVWRLSKHSAKENEPPLGGSETGESVTSSIHVEGSRSGLPSALFPDPTGPTRHG